MTRHRAPLLLAATLLAACGSDTVAPREKTPRQAVALVRAEGDQQTGHTALPVPINPSVMATDISGSGVPGVLVRFTPVGGGWVTESEVLTNAQGIASTTWYLGPTPGGDNFLFMSSAVGGTGYRAHALPLEPGETFRGRTGLIEFTMGDVPLILTAPHGGSATPADIPVRTTGRLTNDPGTLELVQEMAARLRASGAVPFTLVSLVHPERVDVDATLLEAAQGNRAAEYAWREYHGFLQAARQYVHNGFGGGLLLDVHGHGGTSRVELGYLLSAADLMQDDQVLNSPTYVQRSSIRKLAEDNASSLSYILRGGESLGELLKQRGYDTSPSPSQPAPVGPYAAGSYTTAVYGSRSSPLVSAIYLDVPAHLRTQAAARSAFGNALVESLHDYFQSFYGGRALLGR